MELDICITHRSVCLDSDHFDTLDFPRTLAKTNTRRKRCATTFKYENQDMKTCRSLSNFNHHPEIRIALRALSAFRLLSVGFLGTRYDLKIPSSKPLDGGTGVRVKPVEVAKSMVLQWLERRYGEAVRRNDADGSCGRWVLRLALSEASMFEGDGGELEDSCIWESSPSDESESSGDEGFDPYRTNWTRRF